MTSPTTPDHRHLGSIPATVIAILTLILVLGWWGVWIEQRPTLSLQFVIIGFYTASLGGISAANASACTDFISWAARICGYILSLVAWRICYFPIVVLAGTATCYYEWLLTSFGYTNVSIFPVFFVVVATMNGLLAVLVCKWYSLTVWSRTLTLVILLMSYLISFSTAEDLALLPDKVFEKLRPRGGLMQPVKNPYTEFIVGKNSSLGQKTIAFAGSILYPVIPQAPWAKGVKGTLENAFLSNPRGSSFERLGDHYGAFVAVYEYLRRNPESHDFRDCPELHCCS